MNRLYLQLLLEEIEGRAHRIRDPSKTRLINAVRQVGHATGPQHARDALLQVAAEATAWAHQITDHTGDEENT